LCTPPCGVKCESHGLQVGSSRGKDNAHKALEMLASQHGETPHSLGTIPPTSPVEHGIGGKKKNKKSQAQAAPQS